jgi:hypothetical protein
MSFTKQEWNNGTIYRVFVSKTDSYAGSPYIDIPVDIAQSELTGKVFIGIENFVLDRELGGGSLADFHGQDSDFIDFWAAQQYLLLRSYNLPADIDYSTYAATNEGSNSRIFARLPLKTEYLPKEGVIHPMVPRVIGDYSLNKDGILYEMTNNPLAISNGRLRVELLNTAGAPFFWSGATDIGDKVPIANFAFTLVIYKPRNTYN